MNRNRYFTGHTRSPNSIKLKLSNFTQLTQSMEQSPSSKLTGSQPVTKFPAFYATRKFITAVTRALHLSVYWATSVQSMHPHPTSWRPILILSSHLRLALPNGHFPSGPPLQNPVNTSPFSHTCYVPRPSHSARFYHPNNNGWGVQVTELLTM